MNKKKNNGIFKITSRRLIAYFSIIVSIGGTGFYALLLLCIRDQSFLPLLYGFGYGLSTFIVCLSTAVILDLIQIKTKVIISNENINIYLFQIIKKELYFMVKWEDINEFKVIEERHEATFAAGEIWPVAETTGYKLNFFNSNRTESIRLWCFKFTKRKQKKIVKKLIEISNKKDKKVFKEKSSNKTIKLSDNGCENIKSFIKKHFPTSFHQI